MKKPKIDQSVAKLREKKVVYEKLYNGMKTGRHMAEEGEAGG